MITRIIAQNIKGESFDQEVCKNTLIIGPNGSGKSARSNTMLLAILGYIPGTNKTLSHIYRSFSDGAENMSAGVELNGKIFERQFFKTSSGITQRFRLNRKNYSKTDFTVELSKNRAKIVDLSEFDGLSNQKKMDVLFDLFPPSESIKHIDTEIETVKNDINRMGQNIRGHQQTIERLSISLSQLDIPQISLNEISSKISEIESELLNAKNEAQEIEKRKAAELATKVAEERARVQYEAQEIEKRKAAEERERERALADAEREKMRRENTVSDEKVQTPARIVLDRPEASPFDKIIEAFSRTNCNACFARVIALKERSTWKSLKY